MGIDRVLFGSQMTALLTLAAAAESLAVSTRSVRRMVLIPF